jgi:hypothetical protein
MRTQEVICCALMSLTQGAKIIERSQPRKPASHKSSSCDLENPLGAGESNGITIVDRVLGPVRLRLAHFC